MKVKLRNPDREVELSGTRRVRDVLSELSIDPDTVLVISGGARGRRSRCKRCGEPAVIELRRHNAAFCQPCFERYVRGQVERAIDDHSMFGRNDRVMVAVSGGKDSLALWDVLLQLGYR